MSVPGEGNDSVRSVPSSAHRHSLAHQFSIENAIPCVMHLEPGR